MVEKPTLEKIKKYIQLLREHGIPVSQVFLFGSHVSGKADAASDIDLLVVSPVFDQDRMARAGELWALAFEIDSRIEPIPAGEKAFRADRITPIYEIVRNEGLKVPV
jgi:predicted nucleotidyltransferase